jgi:hypothetical protein
MFNSPATAALTSQPRKGIGARVAGGFSRFGAALRSVVAGSLRRPQSGPDSRTAPDTRTASYTRTVPDADAPPAARPARAPRQPSRVRKGGLARLFDRRRVPAAVPEQSRELPDFDFTAEAFPELCPEARAFFNTPLEQCDPELLGIVLEALAELIAGSMTPQEGMRDVRDVFLALSSRLAAVSGEAGHAPPAALPEVAAAPADAAATDAPADLAATVAIDPQAASPELPGPAQQLPDTAQQRDSAAPQFEETALAHSATAAVSAAAVVSAAPDQPATAPAGPRALGVPVSGTSTKTARAPDSSRVPPRHAQRRSFRGGPGFAMRSLILPRRNVLFRRRYVIRTLPRPARLSCYAACAGPPALLRRA